MVKDLSILIEKFCENSLQMAKVPLEDYKTNNKLFKSNVKIVDNVFILGKQDEFFQTLLLQDNVYIRKQVAGYMETRNYDLKKSLEIYKEILYSNKLFGVRKEIDEFGCEIAIERLTKKLAERNDKHF